MSGTAERYSKAATSSHLRMTEHPGDVDVITAAGWADSLGTVLLRCRSEWDAQRAQLEQAAKNRTDSLVVAAQVRKAAKGQTEALAAALLAEEMGRHADEELQASGRLIRLSMQSLDVAIVRLRRLALDRAHRRGYSLDLDVVHRCVTNALDVWLDRRCNACAGRGLNGGYGTPVISCRKCRATGERRRVFPAKFADEYSLGEWLMAQADAMLEQAQRRIGQALR